QVVVDDVPDARELDLKVGVRDPVAQVDNPSPRNLGVSTSEKGRKVPGRLSDDQERMKNGPNSKRVADEGIVIQSRGELLDVFDLIQDVSKGVPCLSWPAQLPLRP